MSKLRRNYILVITLTYLIFGLIWILLSDSLLFNFIDSKSIIWVSTLKGLFFVVISALGFLTALSFMPQEDGFSKSRLRNMALSGNTLASTPISIKYLFAIIIVLLIFFLRTHLGIEADHRPLMSLFMVPILLSALFGGFGPGILATVLAAAIVRYIILESNNQVPPDTYDLLQLAVLIFCGITVSIFSEILDKVRAKSEKNLELLNFLVTNTNDPIYVKDTNGNYVLINQAAANLVGKPIQEILNKNDTLLFPEDVAKNIMQVDRKVLYEGFTDRHEQRLLTSEGKTVFVDVNKGPIYDDAGNIIGLYGISRDITSNKEHEKERINQEISLRKSLVREVHHRIKNSLQGATGLLEQTKSNHPEISGDVNTIIGQIKSISIIHGLQGQNENSEIIFLELLKSVIASHQSILGKTISLKTLSPLSNWILVESESVPISLIINELLMNAGKHEQLSDQSQLRVEVSESIDKANVTLSIINHGSLNQTKDNFKVGLSGTGLKLVKLLLPKSGVQFKLDEIENTVSASLIISNPIIHISN